jgi:thiamine diphosphokinase
MTHYPKIMPETLFDAVVVANGAFPKHETLLRILHRTPHVIACDGAAETLLNAGFTAQQITVIGDGDSLAPRLKRQLHFISINEQDDNDLTKATRYVCTQHGQAQPQLTANRRLRIAYLGATGKREDHTLGNIALMVHYYNHFNVQPFMLTDEGIFIAAHGDCSFDVTPGQQISIFNFGCQQLECQGLRWPIYPFETLWQGTLNEAVHSVVQIKADNSYLIYITWAFY